MHNKFIWPKTNYVAHDPSTVQSLKTLSWQVGSTGPNPLYPIPPTHTHAHPSPVPQYFGVLSHQTNHENYTIQIVHALRSPTLMVWPNNMNGHYFQDKNNIIGPATHSLIVGDHCVGKIFILYKYKVCARNQLVLLTYSFTKMSY